MFRGFFLVKKQPISEAHPCIPQYMGTLEGKSTFSIPLQLLQPAVATVFKETT